MVYFKKERISNPVKVNGHTLLWERVSRDTGVRGFDEAKDAASIAVLNEHANNRRLGVVRISSQIYDSLKKKPGTMGLKPLPPGFGPSALPRAHNREAVLPRAERKFNPPLAAPAVVEVSPPPPSVPVPPAPKAPPVAAPVTPPVVAPKVAVLPKPAPAAAGLQGVATPPPVAATPKPPKPPPRTRVKKSEVEAAVKSLQEPSE